MKTVFIQIPCYNEEETLPLTLSGLPRHIHGAAKVYWLVIDDGSTDRTHDVARKSGVDFVIRNERHLGLAKTFMRGLDACMELGADIIINTDADNQYCAEDIQKLIDPILESKADMTIGARPIHQIKYFSKIKKVLQRLGSRIVRHLSQTSVLDSPCGFRALSIDAAMKLKVFTSYTYTHETVIQAGYKGIRIESVPISVNQKVYRPSRLVKNNFLYVSRCAASMIKMFFLYRPMVIFSMCALLNVLSFFVFFVLSVYWTNVNVALISLGMIAISVFSFLVLLAALLNLFSANRALLEDLNYKTNKIKSKLNQMNEASESPHSNNVILLKNELDKITFKEK